MKNTYIEIMDRAFGCYTKDQIADYYERVKREGLSEHGFPRLASNLGVLICHVRRKELLPLFLDLMDLCCEQMPKVHAANDFSVREVVTCLLEVEKAGIVEGAKLAEWKSAIAGLDPWKCYDCIAKKPDQFGKAIILPAMVETYAILALLISILAVNGINGIQV